MSGSQLVSTTATTGMPSLRASFTALISRVTSITTSAPGSLVMLRMPSRLRRIFVRSRVSWLSIFLE